MSLGSLIARSLPLFVDPSTAPDAGSAQHPGLVRVTHRFHPWFGREFEIVKRRKNWHDDRVYFYALVSPMNVLLRDL
jgi:Family of unknown function (DUF5372)